MGKYAMVISSQQDIDLDPFPCVPPGAMCQGESFVVQGALSMLDEIDVSNVIIATDTGLAYLRYASTFGAPRSDRSMVFSPEVDEKTGSGTMLRTNAVTHVRDIHKSLCVVPANVITDLDLKLVEDYHKAKKRPYATVLCVQGDNDTDIVCPSGYRPTNVMFVEQGFLKCGPRKKSTTLLEMVADAQQRGKCAFYLYDGYYFEVNTLEDYLSLQGD